MEKFTVHTGLVVPLDRVNVDTDAIIPKQFLNSFYMSDSLLSAEILLVVPAPTV